MLQTIYSRSTMQISMIVIIAPAPKPCLWRLSHYDVCQLWCLSVMMFVAFDVCRMMTFVGYDVSRIMMFVTFYVFVCVADRVCRSAIWTCSWMWTIISDMQHWLIGINFKHPFAKMFINRLIVVLQVLDWLRDKSRKGAQPVRFLPVRLPIFMLQYLCH